MSTALDGAYAAFHQDLAQRSNAARAFDNFINGAPAASTGTGRIEVINPARKAAFASRFPIRPMRMSMPPSGQQQPSSTGPGARFPGPNGAG